MKFFLLLIIFGMCASRELEHNDIKGWVRNLHHICWGGKCKRYIMGAPINPSQKVYPSYEKCRAKCRAPVFVCKKLHCIIYYVDDGPYPKGTIFRTSEECDKLLTPTVCCKTTIVLDLGQSFSYRDAGSTRIVRQEE
ncbi:unnamed protein product [Cylicocyclus nassatus]|uniref:Uncharacterized protein n=1 Tax=Cylicocyclus nassatus TaxID=53992 RepID=A0AA36M5J3_CYLNA|nr:unnamed protein product [Cylicocyclus nassatus]